MAGGGVGGELDFTVRAHDEASGVLAHVSESAGRTG